MLKTILNLLLISGLQTFASAADVCSGEFAVVDLTPVLKQLGPIPKANQIVDNYSVRLWKAHQTIAQHVYSLYVQRKWEVKNFEFLTRCLPYPLIGDDLGLALNQIFKEQSLKRIQKN